MKFSSSERSKRILESRRWGLTRHVLRQLWKSWSCPEISGHSCVVKIFFLIEVISVSGDLRKASLLKKDGLLIRITLGGSPTGVDIHPLSVSVEEYLLGGRPSSCHRLKREKSVSEVAIFVSIGGSVCPLIVTVNLGGGKAGKDMLIIALGSREGGGDFSRVGLASESSKSGNKIRVFRRAISMIRSRMMERACESFLLRKRTSPLSL